MPETITTVRHLVAAGIKLRWPLSTLYPSWNDPSIRGVINQGFGGDFLHNGVWFYRSIGLSGHNGLDFYAGTGDEIVAVFDADVSYLDYGGMGNAVYLRSNETWNLPAGPRKLEAVYGHLKQNDVTLYQEVAAGQHLGLTDNTGPYTTGPHLHFGVRVLKPGIEDSWEAENLHDGFRGYLNPAPLLDYSMPFNPAQNNGKFIRATGPDIYLIQDGRRRKLTDELAFFANGGSFVASPIITLTDAELSAVPSGPDLPYTYQPLRFLPTQLKEYTRLLATNPTQAQAILARYFP